MQVLYHGRVGIWSVGFSGGRKTGENPSKQDENQQQTQPTSSTGRELNPRHIGESWAL